MNPMIFRQSDPRWGSLAYPTASSPVSTDGCGLCAVTHCAIEKSKYWNSTPKTFYPFMKKYAVAGNGTLWDGIDAGLNQFIGNSKRFDSMSAFWDEVAKGNRVGVILFHSGSAPDGTVWTSSGHYVAFTGYKVSNGKHYLYTKDSGSRCHDGFYCYETSMKNCISLLWVSEIKKEGWLKEGSEWHYYENGTMLRNGWAKDSKGWCYLDSKGNMTKSQWVKWKDNWYYLKANGYMASNEWAKDSKGWCYLGADGKMLKGAWIRWKSYMYYVDGDGHMVTGSRNVPCTFDKEGRLMAK